MSDLVKKQHSIKKCRKVVNKLKILTELNT